MVSIYHFLPNYHNILSYSLQTLERSYLLKINGKVAERPQHMLMRVSVGIHGKDIDAAIKVNSAFPLHKCSNLLPFKQKHQFSLLLHSLCVKACIMITLLFCIGQVLQKERMLENGNLYYNTRTNHSNIFCVHFAIHFDILIIAFCIVFLH